MVINEYTFERTYDILHDYLMEMDCRFPIASITDEILPILQSRGVDPTKFKYAKVGKMTSYAVTLDSPKYFAFGTSRDGIAKYVEPVAEYCDKIDEIYLAKRPAELDKIWDALDTHLGEHMLDECQFDSDFNVTCPEYHVPIEVLSWVTIQLKELNAKMIQEDGFEDGILLGLIKNDQEFDRFA